MKIATAAQTRKLEQHAVDAGSSWEALMASAGNAMAEIAIDMQGDVRRARVLVLVGPGNNGGDGLVIARRLHDAGARVALYIWNRGASEDDWPRRDTRARGLPEIEAAADAGYVELRRLVAQADLVVDALLGIGLTRPLDNALCALVETVNRAQRPVLAVDIPTGIHSDTGAVMGCALRATLTAAAGVLKPGHLLGQGAAYAGETRVARIGLPDTLENEYMAETMTPGELRALLPARPADSNKGTYGKVLIAGGSGRYPGAVYLAARGAQRGGAGLVTLATGRSIYGPLAASIHEATFLPLGEEDWGTLGASSATELLDELDGYSAVVVGPGLGREDATKEFLHRLLKIETAKPASGVGFLRAAASSERERKSTSGGVGFVRSPSAQQPAVAATPKAESETPRTFVLDADALNLLAETEGWSQHLAPNTAILTPHPGEMARLMGMDGASAVNEDRMGIAKLAAGQWKQAVVLKGAGTVIADAEGRVAIGPEGNPALATAGTGDVLSGLIGALVAQGLAPFDAARLGVYLHAAAGRLVRDELGEAGAVAGDLLDHLPKAITALRSSGR